MPHRFIESKKTELTTHLESQSGENWEYRIVAIATDCKFVTFNGIGGSSPSTPTKILNIYNYA
jgi:hypothetical protein